MTTLFDSRLSDRDFASHLLHVDDLLTWAKSKRLHLRTTPPIDKSEFVQVEALLCAIERHANNLTPEQALSIVLNDPVLKNDPVFQKYPDDIDPSTCRWLLGAEAHRKWRELLSSAIAAHELALLDFGSKLPINTAPAQTAATPAPVVATGASDGVPPVTKPHAAPVVVAVLEELAKAGPIFNMTKASMVENHEHQWPTINRDIADASANGLASAKAGPRGWNEAFALEWARANNKLVNVSKPTSSLAQAMNSMSSLPGQRYGQGG